MRSCLSGWNHNFPIFVNPILLLSNPLFYRISTCKAGISQLPQMKTPLRRLEQTICKILSLTRSLNQYAFFTLKRMSTLVFTWQYRSILADCIVLEKYQTTTKKKTLALAEYTFIHILTSWATASCKTNCNMVCKGQAMNAIRDNSVGRILDQN